MQLNFPWSIGDKCWAVLKREVRHNETCSSCGHHERKVETTKELRAAVIDAIHLHIDSSGVSAYYHVGFDNYGTTVSDIWKTFEEAEAAIASKGAD